MNSDLLEVKRLIEATDRAIINNNNYTIITNNDKNVNCCTPECDKELIEGPLVATGIASRSAPQDIPPQVEVSSSGEIGRAHV